MPDGPNIMSSSDLMLTFLSFSSEHDVKYLGGLNPFAVKLDGKDVYVYIKNLSPAQLSNNNPDVWRIQLPMRDDFEKIKESQSLFILLGYDSDNEVYTTWNPYWCKQRLNVGKSVSLYSRLSLQQRVHESGVIEQFPLNNEGDVVCVPGKLIYEYIKNFDKYYPEETEFIPKGSSILAKQRRDNISEELYKAFSDIDANSRDYQDYIINSGRFKHTANNYINALRFISKNGIWDKYKYLFANCTNYEQYQEPLKELVEVKEISSQDVIWHGAIKAALKRYLEYWQGKKESGPIQTSLFDNITEVEPSPKKDFELDDFGKIVAVDEELYKRLQPYTKIDYPDYEEMIRISESFYPQMITEKMTPVDWIKLFENLKKVKKNTKNKSNQSNDLGNLAKENQGKKSTPKLTTLRITLPDGEIIYNSSAAKTFRVIIENNYPDLIEEINFGYPVIAKEKMPDFKTTKRSQVQLFNGYWLSTNFNTETKAAILQRISDELGLDLDISIVDKE